MSRGYNMQLRLDMHIDYCVSLTRVDDDDVAIYMTLFVDVDESPTHFGGLEKGLSGERSDSQRQGKNADLGTFQK